MTQTPTDALRLVPVETLRRCAAVLANPKAEHSHDVSYLIEEVEALAAAPASPLPGGGNMDWQSVAMWMGFSASVIKNGEPWSDQCQQHYDEAKAAFARLAAPTGDA